MNATATATPPITHLSPKMKARAAGFFWLMTFVTGTSALIFDTRSGVVTASLLATASYIGATLFIYAVLKPVNRKLSLVAAVVSIVGCALGAVWRLHWSVA